MQVIQLIFNLEDKECVSWPAWLCVLTAPARVALRHAAKGLPEEFKKLLSSQLNFGPSEVCNENVGRHDKLA